jgi:Icc protein
MTDNPRFTVVHLSDVHATVGELLYGRVDGIARLEQVGEYVVAAGVTPEAVVITGDLVQRGHAAASPALADALLADVAEEARALRGHEAGHHRSVTVGGMRIVLLDTSTGAIDDAQLDWLDGELSTPHGEGTVIAMHHPPVPSPLPTLSRIGLRDPERFARVVAGSDARVILAGHYHHPMTALFHGLPVAVGPSLAYHQVMNAGPRTVSGHDLAMFSLVQITADQVGTAPVSLQATNPLFSLPAHSLTHR